MSKFLGKVAVVTGAGSGIGRELARQLAARGARLALSDVNAAAAEETAKLCEGAELRCYRLDVSSREQMFAHADAVKRDFGTVHFLFNNAGVALLATVEHATIEEIEWQVNINLWGVILGTKAFLPMMLAQREGHIVNLSSVLGLMGEFGHAAYCVSKFGVRGWTESLWRELAGTGVTATTVHPGGIRTNIGTTARVGVNAGKAEAAISAIMGKVLITPPEDCARDILNGVELGQKRILTGSGAQLIGFLTRLLPVGHVKAMRFLAGLRR